MTPLVYALCVFLFTVLQLNGRHLYVAYKTGVIYTSRYKALGSGRHLYVAQKLLVQVLIIAWLIFIGSCTTKLKNLSAYYSLSALSAN